LNLPDFGRSNLLQPEVVFAKYALVALMRSCCGHRQKLMPKGLRA
jgi:hypothetical protein